MDVRASSVVRVIIAGEWIWVEPGTFTVQDFIFVDDAGNEINRSSEPAYQFTSTNGDPYFGPLSAIQLIKLRSPELDALRPEPQPSQELPQPREAPAAPADAAAAASQRAADSLFSDPIPMPSGESAEPGRGLL
jgi:hypothetical protein